MITRGHRFVAASLLFVATAPGLGVAPPAAPAPGPASGADSAQVARLLVALRASDPLVCALATEVLGTGIHWRSGWEGIASLHDEAEETHSTRHALRESITDPAALRLIGPELGSPNVCVRRTAAALLGESGKPQALGVLRAAIASSESRVREAGTYGLGIAADTADAPRLRALLGDRDADVVRLAAWALGAIGDEASTTALVPLLRHQQAGVRRAAAWALGMMAEGRS